MAWLQIAWKHALPHMCYYAELGLFYVKECRHKYV